MDFKESAEKNVNHFELMKTFIKKILELKKNRDRLAYLKQIKNKEIDFISEIILNFIKKRIPVDYQNFSRLKRIEQFMKEFIKNKKAYKLKKKVNSIVERPLFVECSFPTSAQGDIINMKEFVLIKRSRYDQLMKLESCQTLARQNELPPEIENNLEGRRILEERIATRNVQSGKVSQEESVQVDFPPVKMEHEHKSKNEINSSRIIPIYVNTIPKVHREKATEIVEDLVNRQVIRIDSDGYITKPGGKDMMSFEEFLRAIMI